MRFYTSMILCISAAAMATAQAQKNYKDRQEYDNYSEVMQDFAANNFTKALTDLRQWTAKYSDSDFQVDRQILFVQAYAGANQAAEVLDAAAPLLADDKFPSSDPASVIRVLYDVVSAIQRVPDPSSQQITIASKAAVLLDAYDSAPEGVTASAWASTRVGLQSAARAARLYIAVLPASRAMKVKDCPSAAQAAIQAIQEFPDSVQAAWYLALANVCLAKTEPERITLALYELARAATLDPAKGMVDAGWQQTTVLPYLESSYARYHGADQRALKELEELAARSSLPPPGLVIESASEIARKQQAEIESQNPELALWLKIKSALSANDGVHYFETELKGVVVPELQGALVEARPACRPTELRVAIGQPQAEIKLKLAKRLPGKPELGTEFRWTGTAATFSNEPFLLTMEAEPTNVKGLALSPCPPSAKKTPAAGR
jgi:hypothetical protein